MSVVSITGLYKGARLFVGYHNGNELPADSIYNQLLTDGYESPTNVSFVRCPFNRPLVVRLRHPDFVPQELVVDPVQPYNTVEFGPRVPHEHDIRTAKAKLSCHPQNLQG